MGVIIGGVRLEIDMDGLIERQNRVIEKLQQDILDATDNESKAKAVELLESAIRARLQLNLIQRNEGQMLQKVG